MSYLVESHLILLHFLRLHFTFASQVSDLRMFKLYLKKKTLRKDIHFFKGMQHLMP